MGFLKYYVYKFNFRKDKISIGWAHEQDTSTITAQSLEQEHS
uniref:Uncharacterized protein n=1 Tax=Ditylenchus dipsaci TaxID=166011 RepID=A0A915ERP5_9BILA